MTTNPTPGGDSLAAARSAHATPRPAAGDLWRARWDDQAGVLLVLGHTTQDPHAIRAVPVSLDETPDETALLASAVTNTLALDLAVWAQDEAVLAPRVLDYKLGELQAELAELPRGDANWGPTDPRTVARARLQDLLETFGGARWAPVGNSDLDLGSVLRGADVRAIADILGAVPRAAALRRGQVDLSRDEAERLSLLLGVPADGLLAATQPSLPEELVAAMDTPEVRSLVDRLAARRDAEEVSTWRSAAYGVLSLAAREHDRRSVRWAARISAYFDAHLGDQGPEQ